MLHLQSELLARVDQVMLSLFQVFALVPLFLQVFLLLFVPLLFPLLAVVSVVPLVLLSAAAAEVVIVVLVLDVLVLLVSVLSQQLPLQLPRRLLGVYQRRELRVLVPMAPAPVQCFMRQKLRFYGVLHLQHVLALYV